MRHVADDRAPTLKNRLSRRTRPECPVYVIRLSLGRRLVNLLPVAQRTNAFTNGVVGRTLGRWS